MTDPVIEKKKPGRPKGSTGTRTLTREHQARLQAARELKAKKKKIEKLEVKLSQERGKFKNKKEALTSPVLTETTKENLPTKVKEFIEENKESIVFKPNAGPQTDFLAAAEQDVLYGGAAGGGKSYAMLVDPLRFMHRPAHRALLLRRSMPELRELIDKSRELYPKAFVGAKFREVEKIWRFPSGAMLEFGYLDRDADVYRYQGQAYS
jgi:hypothetical protein